MSKPEQLLVIDPPCELKFVGPFLTVVSSELRLKNPTNRNMLFKVKTTAPKRYCVRPNCGLIEPDQQVIVSVMLQPFDHDPSEKNTHKFMIQSMIAPPGATESTEQLWKDALPSQLIDTKLKCVFVVPSKDESRIKATYSKEVSPSGDNSQLKQGIIKAEVKDHFSTSWNGDKFPEEKDDDLSGSETQHLLQELEKLKSENKKLSDDGMRLRNVSSAATRQINHQSEACGGSQQPLDLLGPLPPILYLVVMLLIGIVLGKFFM